MIVCLVLGLILTPFVKCAEMFGVEFEEIPLVDEQTSCGRRTQAQCDYIEEIQKQHPTWYKKDEDNLFLPEPDHRWMKGRDY
jgi:hypothetical protein